MAHFFLRILWCSQSDDDSENSLAKFGYIIDMKVEKKKKKQNPFIFLATCWNFIIKQSGDLKNSSS
jgi:hypothetical protein